MMTWLIDAPPRASGPYTCVWTANLLSYITAARPRMTAERMIPCPPNPENLTSFLIVSPPSPAGSCRVSSPTTNMSSGICSPFSSIRSRFAFRREWTFRYSTWSATCRNLFLRPNAVGHWTSASMNEKPGVSRPTLTAFSSSFTWYEVQRET